MKSLYLSDVGDNEPDVVEEKLPHPPLVDDDDTGDDNDIDFGDDDEDEDDEN